MSSKSDRGTKRKCQNDDCALPFYDLNRTEYSCPNCGTAFDVGLAARIQEALLATSYSRKPARTYVTTAAPVPGAADVIDPIEADDAAVDKEGVADAEGEVEADAVIDQDALLEQEDEADDVPIEPITGPVKDE